MANEQPNAMDLIIQIKTILKERAFNEAQKQLQALSKAVQNINSPIFSNLREFSFKDIKTPFRRSTKDIALVEKALDSLKFAADPNNLPLNKRSTKQLTENLKTLDAPIKNAREQVRQANNAFQAWNMTMLNFGLSVLFFGMSIQRMSTNILKSGITAFRKITEGTQEASGAFGVLEVHTELLKFSIGAALATLLEAWLPTIIDIILRLSDWIQQNDELVAKIIVFGTVIGALMAAGGSLILFLNGVASLLVQLGLLGASLDKNGAKVNNFSKAWNSLKTGAGIALLVTVGFRIFNRDYQAGFKDILLDALIAGFGGFLLFGPAGLLAIPIVIALDLAPLISGMSTFNTLLTFADGLIASLQYGFEGSLIAIKGIGNVLKAIFTGDFLNIDNIVKDAFQEITSTRNLYLASVGTKAVQRQEEFKLANNQIQKTTDTMNLYTNAGTEQAEVLKSTVVPTLNDATKAMMSLGQASIDATGRFLEGQIAIQRAMGLTSNAPGQSRIDYTTGTQIGNAIMSVMHGGKLAGIGQFGAGTLTEAYNAGYRGGTSVATRERPQQVTFNQNGGTYVVQGAGGNWNLRV